MRVLITGGLGFVGGRLAVHLSQAGHLVSIASRSIKAPPSWLPSAKTIEIDWGNDLALERACSGVQAVIHAAGMNAQECSANPVSALEFNGLATARLAHAASNTGVERFIYLSTAHVYGSPLLGDITESSCLKNYHPYATSHVAGENTVLGPSLQDTMQGMVLRLSNVFGAPAHEKADCWMLIVNELCRKAVEIGKLVLRTDGLQHRDFISMSSVCSLIEQLLTENFKSDKPRIFNVGSGFSEPVLSMAQLIQARCQEVLGFVPELHRVQPDLSGVYEHFSFRSDSISHLKFNVDHGTREFEIDRLLQFCQQTFRGSQGSKS